MAGKMPDLISGTIRKTDESYLKRPGRRLRIFTPLLLLQDHCRIPILCLNRIDVNFFL